MKQKLILIILVVVAFSISISACETAPLSPTTDKVTVVATTSILADVISRVGGDLVSVTPLVPPGANEHEYQPSPRDIAAVNRGMGTEFVGWSAVACWPNVCLMRRN